MNVYFLVEGKQTERKVYPSWLSHLLPQFSKVDRHDLAVDNHYYLISGEGYPSLLHHLRDAIVNVNRSQAFRYLVVCLDADEATVEDRVREIEDYVSREHLELANCKLEIVVQNRTFETWFLGNKRIVSAAGIQSQVLRKYVGFYDVRSDDPERMGIHPDFRTHAAFHADYLREAFAEKGLRYTKTNPGHVCEIPFLEQFQSRVETNADHLTSFQSLLALCRRISSEVTC